MNRSYMIAQKALLFAAALTDARIGQLGQQATTTLVTALAVVTATIVVGVVLPAVFFQDARDVATLVPSSSNYVR